MGLLNGTIEFITLEYSSHVHATGVTIRETWGNGFVFEVQVVDLNDELHTVWTGQDHDALLSGGSVG